MGITECWGVLVERIKAAPQERRLWAAAWTLTAAVGAALGVWLWSWPGSVVLIGLGVLAGIGAFGQELSRRTWGTWALIAGLAAVAAWSLALLATGAVSWGLAPAAGPVLCLVGMVVVWRDRPRGEQQYLVPARTRSLVERFERELRRIEPATAFHAVIGRSLLDRTGEAADWLAGAYDQCAAEGRVTALYVEMVRIEINPEQWSLAAFGLAMPPGELLDDLHMNLGEYEWACEEEFVLTGMEDLQAAYERTDMGDLVVSDDPADRALLDAASLATDLITARMWELLAAAHRLAADRGQAVGRVGVLANMHDSQTWPLLIPPAGGVLG